MALSCLGRVQAASPSHFPSGLLCPLASPLLSVCRVLSWPWMLAGVGVGRSAEWWPACPVSRSCVRASVRRAWTGLGSQPELAHTPQPPFPPQGVFSLEN